MDENLDLFYTCDVCFNDHLVTEDGTKVCPYEHTIGPGTW